jgi:hypothetical protein
VNLRVSSLIYEGEKQVQDQLVALEEEIKKVKAWEAKYSKEELLKKTLHLELRKELARLREKENLLLAARTLGK